MKNAVRTANTETAQWNHAPLTPSAGRRARPATGMDCVVAHASNAQSTITVSAMSDSSSCFVRPSRLLVMSGIAKLSPRWVPDAAPRHALQMKVMRATSSAQAVAKPT